VTSQKLTELFSSQGNVTDVQLKHTKEGKFRGFAFVGFQKENEAEAAQKALDKSFIKTSQISVSFNFKTTFLICIFVAQNLKIT